MTKRPSAQLGYTVKQACIAIDVPRGTLNRWIHEGVLRGGRDVETTAGKARHFTRPALVTLGITKKLIDLGLTATSAYQWAHLAVRYFDRHYASSPGLFRELSIYFTTDGEVVFPELAGKSAPVDAHAKLTIFPLVIMDAMKARLKAAEAPE